MGTLQKHRVLKVGDGRGGSLYALKPLSFHLCLKFFMVYSREAKNKNRPRPCLLKSVCFAGLRPGQHPSSPLANTPDNPQLHPTPHRADESKFVCKSANSPWVARTWGAGGPGGSAPEDTLCFPAHLARSAPQLLGLDQGKQPNCPRCFGLGTRTARREAPVKSAQGRLTARSLGVCSRKFKSRSTLGRTPV